MNVFIKEALHVLDYNNNIVDTIFLSDDSLTAGYAYNITIEESNTGYSNLTFTMPTKILGDTEIIGEITDKAKLIDNPKLKYLTPLVKLRYHRQVFYTGTEEIIVQEPVGYGDALVFKDKKYSPDYPNNIIEDYIMDYIVQPTQHKRSGYEVNITYNAIDYPRFNLSKKKVGATINEDTVTKGVWSLYKSEPMSIPGTVQYVKWTQEMSDAYTDGVTIPTEWSPATATEYPMSSNQIYAMMDKSQDWPYGLTATVFWWPITSTGRFEGVLYNEGDYLTLSIYPKFETGEVDVSEITYSLDFYGYTWNYLEKGDSYLTPNNPCNYLKWALETTNWTVATRDDKQFVGTYFDTADFPASGTEDQYLLYQIIKEDSNYINKFNDVDTLPVLTKDDLGKWAIVSNTNGTYQYRWDGSTWYLEENGLSKIETYVYQGGDAWTDITNEIWTASIDKANGVLYDVDQVETDIVKPNHSVGDLFETVALQCSLGVSNSNCYNIITEDAKQFQLYPVFDCVKRTVALKLFTGKNYGLTYRLGYSLENTGVKKDGDKVITKLHCYGGQDNQGNENINLGDAERSYREPEDNPDDREPWDPNAKEYIQARSPYGTEYIYNFKYMYDNGWMTKQQILDLYAVNKQIQELNKSFLEPYTEDFLNTNDAYVDAGVTYSTNQDEFLACINSMMNSYYRFPGQTDEKFQAFPEAPADCRPGIPEKGENPQGYYLDMYYCDECHYINMEPFATCPHCQKEIEGKLYTIHINTWAEEANKPEGTTSEKFNPSSKGHYLNIYNTFEGETHKIYLGKKFRAEVIDDLTEVPSTKTNETKFYLERTGAEFIEDEFYDKSSGLYNWNDYVDKWKEYLGYAIENQKKVVYYQNRIEMLEQEFKNYQYDLEKLEDEIQDKWGDYIIEGKFEDSQIVYPAVLLTKSLEASEKYSVPEITYNLNVIDSSGLIEYRKPCPDVYNELVHTLHSVGQIVPKVGDYVRIYDEQLGLVAIPGLITNIKRTIDKPQSNSITLDTAYTDADDLVGNIITATNTVLNNTDIYARTAVLKSDGSIDGAALTKTLEENTKENISIIGVKGSTLLDSTGLTVTNPSDPNRKMRYTGGGIYGTVDNGASYDLMMGPNGINANYINAGLIDTQAVQIISGQKAKVKLDNLGLSVIDNTSKTYQLPSKTDVDGDGIRDWSNSNLKAFIGVDNSNEAFLYLNGQMVIDKGSKIAGWKVLEDKLYSGSGSSYVGLGTSGDYRIWAGNAEPSKAPFRVKADGSFNASNGTIGGWNVTKTYIDSYTGTRDNYKTRFYIASDQDSAAYYLFARGLKQGSTTEYERKFSVDKQGNLFAKNVNINGTITTDNITATGGTIGGWTIGKDKLSGNGKIFGGEIAGSKIICGGTFKVTGEGELTAAKGSIGGFNIDENSLTNVTEKGGTIGIFADGRINFGNNYGWLNIGQNGVWLNGNSHKHPVWLCDSYTHDRAVDDENDSVIIRSEDGRIAIRSATNFGGQAQGAIGTAGGTNRKTSDIYISAPNGSTRIYSAKNTVVYGDHFSTIEAGEQVAISSSKAIDIGKASDLVGNVSDCHSIYIGGVKSRIRIGQGESKDSRSLVYIEGYATYRPNGDETGDRELATMYDVSSSSSSTLNIKTNIKKKDTTDVISILDNIELYDYNYIPEVNKGKKDYGYIIDYLEKIPGVENYLEFMPGREGEYKTKRLNTEHLTKFLLASVIELNKEIKQLKKEKTN